MVFFDFVLVTWVPREVFVDGCYPVSQVDGPVTHVPAPGRTSVTETDRQFYVYLPSDSHVVGECRVSDFPPESHGRQV